MWVRFYSPVLKVLFPVSVLVITRQRSSELGVCPILSVSVVIFEIFGVQFWWSWTRKVQGHPRLMVMMLIGSPLVVSYMTPLCPTLSLSRHSSYLMWKPCGLYLGRFKVIQGQRWWCQSTAHGWLLVRLLLTPTSTTPFLKYLTCNFNDLELGLLKVIQGQRSWCQSKAHWWFPIWSLLLYISRYSRYLMQKVCDLDLGRFKVIQGQRSWCQSIAHR